MTDFFDDVSGLEKNTYSRFYNNFVIRRPNQAPNKFDHIKDIQLPTGSILHSLNGFNLLNGSSEGLPDPNLFLAAQEKLSIFLKINSLPSDSDTNPLPVNETYIYRLSILNAAISHFYQTHRHYKRILSDRALGTLGNSLVWVDYSPLDMIKVNGVMHHYRKFDMIFRTILNKIVSIGANKYHYILLPQNEGVFSRSAFIRSFKELNQSTVNNFKEDASIYPLIHLLGFVYGKMNDITVTPYKNDLKLLGKDNSSLQGLKSTSLINRIPETLFESINFILVHGDKAVIYNLADLNKFAEDMTFYTKFYRHLMNLRLTQTALPQDLEIDSDKFDTYIDQVSEDQEITPVENNKIYNNNDLEITPSVTTTTNAPTIKTSNDVEYIIPISKKTVSNFEEKIRKAVATRDDPVVTKDPAKVTKRETLLENHLKVTLANKPLSELIQTPAISTIVPKDMDFIDKRLETSYQKSSLLAMDRTYQTHVYHHDMAKVLGSLAKQGLFISKIDEDKTHTEMDRLTTYKLQLNDINGKTHHLKYTIPDVDQNGMMKIGGIEYRLTRQMANIPICKISPSRVNLSSYYNKIIVSRITSKRFSYEQDLLKLLTKLKDEGFIDAVFGTSSYPSTHFTPYDYTALGRHFVQIKLKNYDLRFNGNEASFKEEPPLNFDELKTLYGTYIGDGPQNSLLFMNKLNEIREVKRTREVISQWSSFTKFLVDQLGDVAKLDKTSTEWTQADIINQTIPLVFILGYHLGLRTVFEKINLDYRFYENKNEVVPGVDDISVQFSDGILVFNRYPLSRSLIAAGLLWANLSKISFRELSFKETYTSIFNQKGMSLGVLKGLNGFFDFFVDPITETVLEKMGEPTNFDDLLLRANIMLSDYYAEESSSLKFHRFRLYERFNGILYNEIYRGLSNYRNQISGKKSFSINPEAVFQKIIQDATVSPNEVINPVHEVKLRANFTFTGSGGRTADSFVLKDRIYPKDGLGVISEAVPDSGKVGITSYLSTSPNIDDVHGIPKPYKSGDKLEAPQILAIGSMVMPGGTTDDGKRNAYLNIQISHYVPNHKQGETLCVRTGYDAVLPHLVSETFAISAEEDGIVETIDDKQKILKLRYADKLIKPLGTLKLNYLDAVLETYKAKDNSVGYLIKEEDISQYPLGGIFKLTNAIYGKIIDRLRCETIATIPDKDVIRKQSSLVKELETKKTKALYYLRLKLIDSKTPGVLKNYSFSDIYSQNSGSYLLQKRIPRVKIGDKIKRGDILIYNSGFFVPDSLSNQVTFKHGVTATIALIERSSNHEDASEISLDFAKRLEMTPCYKREVITKKNAVILKSVKIGDYVQNSDSLCIISDDYLVGDSLEINSDNLDILEKLNRQTPTAHHTGRIVKLRLLYSCPRDELSDSLKSILKTYEKEVRDHFKILSQGTDLTPPEKPGWVPPKTRYEGIEFDENTVVLEYMIEENLGMAEGDKFVLGNALKSIVSHVSEKTHYTESNIPVDVLFSTTSVSNRIVASPLSIGIAERVMETLKKRVLDTYFG